MRKKNKFGQYFTPASVAKFMVDLVRVREDAAILEPCSGEGVFIDALQQQSYTNITAYEIDKKLSTPYDFVQRKSFVSVSFLKKFDLVIGNPPYIRWKNLEPKLKEELEHSELWQRHCNKLCDYLCIFILKAIENLNEGGQLIFICPDYWMNTTHSIGLRNFMLTNGYFEAIYRFGETPIFDKVTVSTIIFSYRKSEKAAPTIKLTNFFDTKKLNETTLAQIQKNEALHALQVLEIPPFQINERWLLLGGEERQHLESLEVTCRKKGYSKGYTTIGDFCEIGNGLVSGLDAAFRLGIDPKALNEKEQDALLSVVKAKHLQPYFYEKKTLYMFVNGVEDAAVFERDYPHFAQQLAPYQSKLEQRYQYKRVIPYWEWVFLRNFKLFQSNEARIFVACKERISHKAYFRFVFAEKGVFPTQDVTAIFKKEAIPESIYYFLAYLNQPAIFFWLSNKGIVKGSIVEFSEQPLASIPFRTIDWSDETEVGLHDQISELCRRYIHEKDQELQKKITTLFMKLGLKV